MVVGGGIAGIQASLDLAEAGFKVYLVEAKSAIGGHMAQLDKTFPTNDCAMCIISPKLVQAGRHLNINILTDTEVAGLSGKAGHFTATLRRKPRYIDLTKCTGCGDCEKVCPIVLPDMYNEGLARRHAAYRLYPQAVPAAYAIEKRGISPCRDACPVNTRAQGYIALVREGRYADALRVIKEENPFPGICGRICNHRCETACNRNQIDEPIAIKDLKRFIVDQVYAQPRQPIEPIPCTRSERIAIIGSGPCGLTTAMDLVKQGYGVTVFEALPVAGGMLRVGVPEYRLPSWIADREVQDIVDLGVELRLNTTVNSLDDVFAEGFQAVLIAVGAHEGKKLRIPGADLDGVLINTRFLRDVRLGNPPDLAGRHVLVLGGGNVAIDVARTAVRLNAAEVHLACLESREQMPAHPWEIADAEAEGVVMHPARSFTRILSDGDPALSLRGHVAGVECVHVKFMEFDSEGRLNLETQEGSEHVLPCDTVIFSIGQAAGLAFIPADTGVGTTRQGTVAVNPNTLAATRPGVFAAGDSVTGTAFVIEAVAAGHRAAESIHLYLQGEPMERPPRALELPVVKLTRSEIDARIDKGEVHAQPRVHVAAREAKERVRSFDEVELGYTEEEARAEAARCLACGICSECLSCYYACGAGAVVHDMVERTEEIEVGAVILAPGYEAYRAELSEEFGFGRYANVVTGLQFERLLSASGPTSGHVKRPSDHERPQRIAFLQCIGSRDQTHDYCSAVCCMYATKQAIMAKEHEADTEVHVFMMDMRAFGKGYEEYYRRAQRKYRVQYTRCRVSAVKEDPQTRNIILRYDLDGQLCEEQFDLVVLSVGMEISNEVKRLGHDLGIELDDYGFCHTVLFNPLQTSRRGIYVAGPFREPKDIPETVVEASGAAAAAGELLAPARGTLTRLPEYPPERDVAGEAPRIGVFICHCGSNIAGYIDVPGVVEYTKTLPGVIHAENNLYTCSQDTIKHITEQIKELGLNRVVVASCTPRTHEPLFQDSLRMAGLNPYFFEMANIRNQCSWVHGGDREGATKKAKSLVRMAVGRATRLMPLHTTEVPVEKAALVIGGGAAGLNAALSLAEQGFPVHLIERTGELGGNLRYVYYTSESLRCAQGKPLDQASDPQRYLRQLIDRVQRHPRINVHMQTELLETSGFVGNFVSRLGENGREMSVRHGATIVATGGQEYRGEEYACGNDPRVITQQEFEGMLANRSNVPDNIVMIQCVGPAARYCSRICCTTALKNALKLKELNPAAQVTMLFKDIRTYGFKERLYTQAREAGVLFVHYDDEHEPQVEVNSQASNVNQQAPIQQASIQQASSVNRQSVIGNPLVVRAWEPMLGQELVLTPDLVVLSTPIVPAEGARELANRLKVPRDLDGFFLEAHIKLRPVDFASDGIFMAGLAHYPKFLDETIVQAQAAAARAAAILAQETLMASARVAVVDADRCVACLTCVRLCPYNVPKVKATFSGVGGIIGAAHVEPAACHGCGICAAECPAKAIQLLHSTDLQMLTKIDSLFVPAMLPT
jgi:heterodisulfide reductase subunit A-like polyferredoxin